MNRDPETTPAQHEAPTPASIRADMIGLDSLSLAQVAALVADLRLMRTAPPPAREKWLATKREYLSRIVAALDQDTGADMGGDPQ